MDQNAYFEKGLSIIRRFNECTYEAYLIGGVVRDYLINRNFTDIDIATSATPEEILKIFPHAMTEYLTLGSITIKLDDYRFQITTFRTEEYTKSRRPSKIHYSLKLQDDIARRDFTINGLAMSASKNIIDFCGGENDLKKRKIKAIGKAKKKMRDDPLRILRAFSLMARYNFKIEKNTLSAISHNKKYLHEVSDYKLADEMRKIFEAVHGKKALKAIKRLGLNVYLNPYGAGINYIIKRFDWSIMEKMAICFKIANSFPEIHALTHQEMQDVKKLVNLSNRLENEVVSPIIIYEYGLMLVESANKINRLIVDKYQSQAKIIEKVQKHTVFITTSDLTFKAHHLIELAGGQKGPFIGEIIESIKLKIISGILPNDFEVLKAEALRQLEGYGKTTDNIDSNQDEQDDPMELYNEYKKEFQILFDENLKAIKDFDEMTFIEREAIKKQIRNSVHKLLVSKNPRFKEIEVNNHDV